MAWPDDVSLPVRVWAAFGADLTARPITWVWTDLTDRWRQVAGPIPIRGGAIDAASTGTVVVGNDDGALTPDHAMSAFWPFVDMNTPVMLGVDRLNPVSDSDAFTAASSNSWGLSDQGRSWQTISAGGTISASDYQVTGGVATASVPTALAYRAGFLSVNATDVDVACTVSGPAPTGGPIEPGNLLMRIQDVNRYYMARLSVDPGGVITATLHASGGTGQLASVVVPGLTWAAGVPVRVRAQAWGTWIRMRVWAAAAAEPTTWTLTAENSEYLTPGGVGVRSGVASGNTNTVPVVFSHDNFTVGELPMVRAGVFADSWEPTYTPLSDGTFASSVQVTGSGLFRRLGQGKSALRSAPYRATLAATPPPDVYLPCEDGQLALLTSPSLAGVTVAGSLSYTADGLGASVLSLANAPTPAVTAAVVGGSGLDNDVEFVARWAAGTTVGTRILQWTTSGSLSPWRVNTDVSGIVTIDAFDQIGGAFVQLAPGGSVGCYTGDWVHFRVVADDNGTLVRGTLYINGVQVGTDTALAVGGPVTSVSIMPVATTVDVGFGHLSIWSSSIPAVAPSAYGMLGYRGEPASDRIKRLCAEEDIPVLVEAGESEALDVQQPAGLLDVLRAAARADMGILSEYLWGLRYRPRSARYNLDPKLTVDLATYRYPKGVGADTILKPMFDDANVRNDWTINRAGGSSARAVDTAHQAKYGIYGDSAELEIPDSRLPDHARWRVYLGTWPDARWSYPDMPLHLHANPSLVDAWTALSPGDVMQRINPPTQHKPGPITQIAGAYSEVLAPREWTVQVSGSPYGSWEVSVAGGTQRYCATGSTLASPLAAGALSLSVASTAANGLWTTDPVDYPLDVRVGGERVTVGAVGQVLNANPWFEVDASGWTAFGATATRSTAQAHQGVASLLLTPDGVSSGPRVECGSRPVSAGAQIRLSAWVRCATSRTVGLSINWFDSASVYLSTSSAPSVAVTAGVWTLLTFTATAPAGTGRASGNVLLSGVAPATDLLHIDEATLVPVSTYATSPQTMTIAPGGRGVNGVTRAWVAGTEVDVADPAITPL